MSALLAVPMSAISSLTRREELIVPSWPALSTITAIASALKVGVLRMPAMNVAAWALPIRMKFASAATPVFPMWMLLLPVVRFNPAKEPMAMLSLPVVLFWSAPTPLAVLKFPVVLAWSAPTPLAVLKWPVVLFWSADAPLAVLLAPVVFKKSAFTPLAVLLLPVVLLESALSPLAVLKLPAVLLLSAPAPLAVLLVPVEFLDSAKAPLAVLLKPVVLLWSALFPLAVLALPVIAKLPADTPINVLLTPKLWINGNVPLRILPVVVVEGTSTMFPAGVTFPPLTVVSSVVMRLAAFTPSSVLMRPSLALTAVLTALKLPFTSEALAGVPAVKVVSGPTGPAWLKLAAANSAAIPNNLERVRMIFSP